MPPIVMTREEYKRRYGVSPVLSPTSLLDTEPAPRRMTRAEYDAEFAPQPKGNIFTPAKEAIQGYKEQFGGGEQGIGNKLYQDIKGAGESVNQGYQQANNGNFLQGLGTVYKGITKAGFRTAGDIAGAVYAPFGTAIQATGATKLFDKVGEMSQKQSSWLNPVGASLNLLNKATNNSSVQKYAISHPNLGEDINRAMNLGLASADSSPIRPQTMLPRTLDQVQSVKPRIDEYRANRLATKNEGITQKYTQEIEKIENNYSKLRKANEFSKDAEASRRRIVEADVLPESVDNTGTINSKRAVEDYYNKTIKGKEDIVRQNLVRLGEKVNLEQVRRELITQIDGSGLEGSDLISALNGVKKEIAGLKMRADEFGDIPLEKVHDAKINTTKNIDYNTPPETKTYRKSVARAYKNIVEDNSSFNVKEVNNELSKYYEDITRLENLHGRKVKGGKLGRYSAQIAGNIAGGALGGAVGGLGGMAIGTLVGGEVTSAIKGKTMAGTFGEPRGLEVPKNPILEKAAEQAKKSSEVDLRKPDAKVGAPKSVIKTPEITKLEAQISKNVERQKVAIAKGDFTLVATLKEIYQTLVQKLKDVIKRIKETPNKQGGFIKNPASPTSGKSPEIGKEKMQSSSNGKTDLSQKQPELYTGEKDITLKTLQKLEGRSSVSQQFISDLTNSGDIKQAERDVIRKVLAEYPDGNIPVKEFASKVKSELLPLKVGEQQPSLLQPQYRVPKTQTAQYENISLPSEQRGNVANYGERIYESPIKTSAGNIHFNSANIDNYFAHTRIEDMSTTKSQELADGTVRTKDIKGAEPTRRVIELQSDLFQKGRLELENDKNWKPSKIEGTPYELAQTDRFGNTEKRKIGESQKKYEVRQAELSKLEPYRNTWHERIIREEIKQAAKDGKTKLQFPTGETAMKIEGLGETADWRIGEGDTGISLRMHPKYLKAGEEIWQGHNRYNKWVVTDVLGDGRFKAVRRTSQEPYMNQAYTDNLIKEGFYDKIPDSYKETFDISGKVDTNNPIYRFYEKEVGRYLNKYGAKRITDENGVSWYEVPIKKEMAKLPIQAFAILGAVGLANNKK